MFLILPLLTYQIVNNHIDKFTPFFNPDFAIEYSKAGISYDDFSSTKTINIEVAKLAKYLSANTKNGLVDDKGNVNVKFNITSNNKKNTIDTNNFDVKVATYSNNKLSGLKDNFGSDPFEQTINYKQEGVEGGKTEKINFDIDYEFEYVQIPYEYIKLVSSDTKVTTLPSFIEFSGTGIEYHINLDIMALYDNLNSETPNSYLHIDETGENGKVNLKLEYQYEKYDSKDKVKKEFTIQILTFEKSKKQNCVLQTNESSFNYELAAAHDSGTFTDVHSDYSKYNDNCRIIVGYNYKQKADFKLTTRENGPAAPFFTSTEGYTDATAIDNFEYSTEYEKAGMKFDETTNTISLDRLKLMEYIADDSNKLNYLIAGDKAAKDIYIAYGLQLKDLKDDFLKQYTKITTAPDLIFKALADQTDSPNFYLKKPIIYFLVAKITFDVNNKPSLVTNYRYKDNFLVRYIWQGEQKYANTELRVSIHLNENYETITPEIRPDGPADGLAEQTSENFNYKNAYNTAGITMSNNVITVSHEKLQTYAKNTPQDFLKLCNEYPQNSQPKQYNVYFGITLNPMADYTHFMKGGDNRDLFTENSFTEKDKGVEGSQFYNGKVTRYVKVATFVYDGTDIIIHEIPDESYTYKYIWKKENANTGKAASDKIHTYKLGVVTIDVKTDKFLETDPSKLTIDGVSLSGNNLQVNLNTLINLESFENYFIKSGQALLLPIPYKGMKKELTAIQQESVLPTTIITQVYPFISANPYSDVYSNTVSRLVCVAITEPYKDGEGKDQTRLHPCANTYNTDEPYLLVSDTDYTQGKWSYNLHPFTVGYADICSSDENCGECASNKLTCNKCNEGYTISIKTGLCIKDSGDISNMESAETTCVDDEKVNTQCTVNEEFSNEIVYIEQSTKENIIFESVMPEKAYYKAPGKKITLSKTANLNLAIDESNNAIDISQFADGIIKLKLLTSGESAINLQSKNEETKQITLNTDENKVSGKLGITVPPKVEKLIIKSMKLFGATLSARKPSSLKLLANEQPVLLGFTTLEVNEETSLESNAEINDLTLQPSGKLDMTDYETTVKNIVINLESKTDGYKLITRIPENPKAPDSITINANAIGSDAKTTVPLVAGSYHFDICDKWRDNSKIEKEDKKKFKVICLKRKDVPEGAKHLLKTLEEAGADKEPENSYVLAITNDGSLKDALKKDKKLSGGAIAGIVIACVVVVAAIIALLVYFLVIKKKKDATTSTQGDSSIAI